MRVLGKADRCVCLDYLFFGTVTAYLQAAPGAGIVSAFIMQSDDLDEIDWEWLGGDTGNVQSNYFSKGNTTTYDRSVMEGVATPQTEFHCTPPLLIHPPSSFSSHLSNHGVAYSINWTPNAIEWIIDGTVVRTLTAASAGTQYPQTPMQVRIGTWCGGCPGNADGTIQWAGGPTTFTGAPYIMTITSLTIQNANPGQSYTYGDESGTASSIIVNDPSAPDPSPPSPLSSAPSPSTTSSVRPAASTTATNTTGDPENLDTGGNKVGSVTTLNVGPTATTLPSGASTFSLGIITALVFGTIVFLAGI
jgi:beta-glucanase (GH16 family)